MASTVSSRPGTVPPLRPPPQPSIPGVTPGSEAPAEPDPRVSRQFDSSPDEPTRYGIQSRNGFAPDQALSEQIDDLERWAELNAKHDRREAVRFWLLRALAFLGAAGAAVFAGYRGGWPGAVLGGIGALSVAVEAAWPSRAAKNPFRRALFEIRELENTVRLRWDKVRLAHPDPLAAPRTAHALALLDMIQSRREEIGKYVGSVEAPRIERAPSS